MFTLDHWVMFPTQVQKYKYILPFFQRWIPKYIKLVLVVCRRWVDSLVNKEGRKEMFYLTTHSTHFIDGYMASDIWLRTILIVRKETRCRHIGYSFRLTARVILYAPSHRQDSTYHGLCYTSRGTLAGTRNSSMGSPHEGSIRRPIAPWANALPLSYISLPLVNKVIFFRLEVFFFQYVDYEDDLGTWMFASYRLIELSFIKACRR